MLLGRAGFFLTSGLAQMVVLAFAMGRLGLPYHSTGVIFPVVVSAAATLACWLSSRNVHIALNWAWEGYEQARCNEELARAHQGELRRALKALDEATYRIERTNLTLRLTRDQAEEARRLKQQFAQTISHELRTPLNVIVGFIELMIESREYYGRRLPSAYARDLMIVHRNARHLQNLVNDVLDLARVDAAQLGLLPEDVAPAGLVDEAVNTVRSLADVHGLQVAVRVEPNLPQIQVDPTRIRQVLFNLLSNAVRFTDHGLITVSARQQGEEVVFAVADTGVGIPAEDMSRIFEEFQQVEGGTRRPHGGAGLGLAISKRFVELHGGRIWAESEVGRGSTVSFSLPLAPREPGEAAWQPIRPGRRRCQQPAGAENTSSWRSRAARWRPRCSRATSAVGKPSSCKIWSRHARRRRSFLPQAVVIDTAGERSRAGAVRTGTHVGLAECPHHRLPAAGRGRPTSTPGGRGLPDQARVARSHAGCAAKVRRKGGQGARDR